MEIVLANCCPKSFFFNTDKNYQMALGDGACSQSQYYIQANLYPSSSLI